MCKKTFEVHLKHLKVLNETDDEIVTCVRSLNLRFTELLRIQSSFSGPLCSRF